MIALGFLTSLISNKKWFATYYQSDLLVFLKENKLKLIYSLRLAGKLLKIVME
jgi:hypothetical protein